MKNRLSWLFAVAAVVAAGSASAHHSFAMFDYSKTVTLDGTVKDFQWTNPHAWIEVIVTSPDGPKQYSIEAFNLRGMREAGWKFNTLKPGDKVTVVMNPLRNGTLGGTLVTATIPDGRTLKPF
jgi:hypothetical protein